MLEEVLNETNTIQNSTKMLLCYGLSIKDDSIEFSKKMFIHIHTTTYIYLHAIWLK